MKEVQYNQDKNFLNIEELYRYVLGNILTDEFEPYTATKITKKVWADLYNIALGLNETISKRTTYIQPLLKQKPNLVEEKPFTWAIGKEQSYCGLAAEVVKDLEAYAHENYIELGAVKLYMGCRGVLKEKIAQCIPNIQKQKDKICAYFSQKHGGELYVVNAYRRAAGWEEHLK